MGKFNVAGFFTVLLLVGCSRVVKNPSPLQPQIEQTSLDSHQEYRIQVGDQLEIKFFYNPELNELVVVRPDGRIALQLVQEVIAADLTPSQLQEGLVQKYASEITKPEIAVIVRSFNAQKIYVDGEVTKAGMIPLVGFTTILQAISQAGGVKDTARTSEVIVIRRGMDNKPLVLSVNLKKVINGTDMSQDLQLRPADIVFVPKTPISNVNKWVDQYLRQNIPFNIGIYYNSPYR